MKTVRYLIASIIVTILSLVSMSAVSAQGLKNSGKNLDAIAGSAGVSQADAGSIVGSIINAVLTFVGLIFLVLMVYAGFLWMTAAGDEGKIDKSKSIIIAAIIGLVIVMSAYAITYFVTTRLSTI